eukprot:EG_transcript_2194
MEGGGSEEEDPLLDVPDAAREGAATPPPYASSASDLSSGELPEPSAKRAKTGAAPHRPFDSAARPPAAQPRPRLKRRLFASRSPPRRPAPAARGGRGRLPCKFFKQGLLGQGGCINADCVYIHQLVRCNRGAQCQLGPGCAFVHPGEEETLGLQATRPSPEPLMQKGKPSAPEAEVGFPAPPLGVCAQGLRCGRPKCHLSHTLDSLAQWLQAYALQVGQRLGQRAAETLERSQKTTHGAGNSAALLALRQHKTLQQLRQQFAEAQAERLAPDGGQQALVRRYRCLRALGQESPVAALRGALRAALADRRVVVVHSATSFVPLHAPLCVALADSLPHVVIHVSSSAGAGYRAAQHARRKLHVPVALYPQDSPGLVACGLYGPWLADEATRVVFTTDVALLQALWQDPHVLEDSCLVLDLSARQSLCTNGLLVLLKGGRLPAAATVLLCPTGAEEPLARLTDGAVLALPLPPSPARTSPEEGNPPNGNPTSSDPGGGVQDPSDVDETSLALLLLRANQVEAADLQRQAGEAALPPAAAATALADLQRLGALDGAGAITALGCRLARLPMEPRAARLVLRGVELGVGVEAVALATAISLRRHLAGRPQREAQPSPFLRAHAFLLGRSGLPGPSPADDPTPWLLLRLRDAAWRAVAPDLPPPPSPPPPPAPLMGAPAPPRPPSSPLVELSSAVRRAAFEAYSPNVSMYTGHPALGYYSPAAGGVLKVNTSVALHQSYPMWVVYFGAAPAGGAVQAVGCAIEKLWLVDKAVKVPLREFTGQQAASQAINNIRLEGKEATVQDLSQRLGLYIEAVVDGVKVWAPKIVLDRVVQEVLSTLQ